jgi:hypothetical protein
MKKENKNKKGNNQIGKNKKFDYDMHDDNDSKKLKIKIQKKPKYKKDWLNFKEE